MFRKLKFQFILTNFAIITTLLILLTVGGYILLQIKMVNHAEFFSKRLAAGINSGMVPEVIPGEKNRPPVLNIRPGAKPPKPPRLPGPGVGLPPEPPPGNEPPFPAVYFVKTDLRGNIIRDSSNLPLDAARMGKLIRELFRKRQGSGIANLLHSKYFYYKAPLTKQTGFLLIFQDLKQDKKIQRSLVISLIVTGIIYLILSMLGSILMAKRAISPIQKAWRQQKDFLADASHELRTPLTIIQTNLDVVFSNSRETVASQMDWLNNIQEELRQMTDLVAALLFLARVDSHQIVMDKKIFSLDKLVNRVGEAFKPLASQKEIRLRVSIGRNINCLGDEQNIRQVIAGLLDNAIRHTPAGGEVYLALNQAEQKIILTVADTGEGIAAEHLGKIFDRFYQVDASRSKGKVGLGLSIAKSVIDNHDGKINVTSKPGRGTTFIVELPAPKENGAMKTSKNSRPRFRIKKKKNLG